MSKSLPAKPNLEYLKSQSKTLLKGYKNNSPESISRISNVYQQLPKALNPNGEDIKFTLVDAQFVIAREYGFKSWAKLKEHIESLSNSIITSVRLSPRERKILIPLFESHKYRLTTIRAILDGSLGSAFSDSKTKPQVAMISSGPIKIFGGNTKHPLALDFIKKLTLGDVVCTDSKHWEELIKDIYSDNAICVRQAVPSFENITRTHLLSIIRSAPKDLQIVRMDVDLCSKLHEELLDYEEFNSIEGFIKKGIGFCGVLNGSVVCTSYSIRECATSIDIMTSFLENSTAQNSVKYVAASLVLHCLENNIEPIWQPVFNTEKVEGLNKIAEMLGYDNFEYYNMYVITRKAKLKRAYWSKDGWIEEEKN